MHEGQLVFHTPPYSLQDVTLQDVCHTSSNLKVPGQDSSKICVERSRSVIDHNKDSNDESASMKLSATSASPLTGSCDRKSLGRRFSYTSNRYKLISLLILSNKYKNYILPGDQI